MSKQEQKHTPGPWEAAGQKVFASGLPCSNHVATAYAVGGHGLYANARLIAAAPDLLDALIYLRDCIESGREPGMGDVLRAINKATGGAA